MRIEAGKMEPLLKVTTRKEKERCWVQGSGKVDIRKLVAVRREIDRKSSIDKLSSNEIARREAIGLRMPLCSEAIHAGGVGALAIMAVGTPKARAVRGPR
jgi:hypothetical protein